jgi:hypothetical protein
VGGFQLTALTFETASTCMTSKFDGDERFSDCSWRSP